MSSIICDDNCKVEMDAKNRWRIEHSMDTYIPWNNVCSKNMLDANCQFCVIQRDLNRFLGSDVGYINYTLDFDNDDPVFHYYTTYLTDMEERDGSGTHIRVTYRFYINEAETVSKKDVIQKFEDIFNKYSQQNSNLFTFLLISIPVNVHCLQTGDTGTGPKQRRLWVICDFR